MDIQFLVERLEALVVNARKVPMTSQIILEQAAVLDLIDQMRVAIPDGHAGLVLPRSGLALRTGVTVLNAPGLIDSGYRGEIGVLLINHGAEPVTIGRGERIAQLVIQAVARATLLEVPALGESTRNSSAGSAKLCPSS
jgi:dUTP pyrophosphatase